MGSRRYGPSAALLVNFEATSALVTVAVAVAGQWLIEVERTGV